MVYSDRKSKIALSSSGIIDSHVLNVRLAPRPFDSYYYHDFDSIVYQLFIYEQYIYLGLVNFISSKLTTGILLGSILQQLFLITCKERSCLSINFSSINIV
ncbi:hypothetical protein [Candidatus Tisiphia endosymbiont of Thecophora atra]|uniref:hypothetical protein n=1 Tax=Candidatus Tisiphia endosymbiont of Thecophora atra TaxID=3066258 RepID=UPI00312CA839